MEKTDDTNHVEQASGLEAAGQTLVPPDQVIGYEASLDDLPKGYYTSRFFIGSMAATALGLWAGTCAFGYIAAVISVINEDIGPDSRYVWISLVNNVTLAVSLGPIGRLSDIFGRRYFFIGGGVLACVGAIVSATAKTIPVLIGGNVLLGVASASQLCFHFVMGELVPMKYRYVGNACLYVFTYPSAIGPTVAYGFIQNYPSVGWRGLYWFLLAINGAALICWICFYFPPSFTKKHLGEENASATYWLIHFDYVGMVLFAGGLVTFMLGLSWGGTVYPWKSAGPIAGIVVGGVVLVLFVLWEIYAPIKEPLVPLDLFRNTEWVSSVVLLGLGAAVYYAFAIIWPTQVSVLYSDGKSLIWTGAVGSIIGIGIVSGQITAGSLATRIGKTKIQCFVVLLIGGIFLACASIAGSDDKTLAIPMVLIGCYFIGWNESICLSNSTICVRDQREIGVAGGMAGSIRASITCLITTIYTTILTNRSTKTVAQHVPKAVTKAGLPSSSVEAFIKALSAGREDALKAVPGVTDAVIAAGTRAYKAASAEAYRTVYLTTIAFTCLAVFLAYFSPNTEKYMSNKVAATLNNEDNAPARQTAKETTIGEV